MSDFPQAQVLPQFVHPWTFYGPGPDLRLVAASANPVAFTWTANTAVYIPMTLPWPYPVNRVFWVNGSNVASANADFGIYTPNGNQIYHTGSTALSGASVPQFVTPSTPFILDAGNYYFAYACDGTTSKTLSVALATAQFGSMCGIFSQATAFPLPSSATFAALGATLGVPLCGITRTPSGF